MGGYAVRITINEDEALDELEVIINCSHADDRVLKIIASLRSLDNKLIGIKDEQTFLLNPGSVLYMESVDKRAFIYCLKEVYETPLRLYELEEKLSGSGFFRASKSTIINLSQVRSLRPDLGGRLLVTMNNGEKMLVSRQYASNIKEKLGL